MNNRKIKFYLFYFLLSVIIFGAISGIVDNILDNIYLKRESAFAISNKITLSTVSKAGTDYHYSFFLKGKWYAGYTSLPLHRDGTKYFIKFYPPNPNRNKATEIIATPEDIKNLPPDGYKQLPHE